MSRFHPCRPTRSTAGRRVMLLGIVVVGLAAAEGCGRRGLDGLVPVSGRVTFGGGACPAGGFLFFVPTTEGSGRAGSAPFGPDGAFSVTTLAPGDGLLPGDYIVRIQCWETAPDDSGTGGRSHVPAGYEPPRLTVAPAVSQTYDIDVPAAR